MRSFVTTDRAIDAAVVETAVKEYAEIEDSEEAATASRCCGHGGRVGGYTRRERERERERERKTQRETHTHTHTHTEREKEREREREFSAFLSVCRSVCFACLLAFLKS